MLPDHSSDALLGFLQHASDRGLMPATTAQALKVACRNVFATLSDAETVDVRALDVEAVIGRFTDQRADDFNPTTVTEYARRVRRAVELFLSWRSNPASLTVRTRATNSHKPTPPVTVHDALVSDARHDYQYAYPIGDVAGSTSPGGYQTSVPLRAGQLVTLSNVPQDLTVQEAERLASFVRMLAIG